MERSFLAFFDFSVERLSGPAHFAMCWQGVKAQEGAVLGGVGPARRGRAGQRGGARQERAAGRDGPGSGARLPGTGHSRLFAQREKVARSPGGVCALFGGAGQVRAGRSGARGGPGRAGAAGSVPAGRAGGGMELPSVASVLFCPGRGGAGTRVINLMSLTK